MFTLREKSTLKKYKKVMKVLKYKRKMEIYNITPNTPFVQSCKPNIKSWLYKPTVNTKVNKCLKSVQFNSVTRQLTKRNILVIVILWNY